MWTPEQMVITGSSRSEALNEFLPFACGNLALRVAAGVKWIIITHGDCAPAVFLLLLLLLLLPEPLFLCAVVITAGRYDGGGQVSFVWRESRRRGVAAALGHVRGTRRVVTRREKTRPIRIWLQTRPKKKAFQQHNWRRKSEYINLINILLPCRLE